MVQTATRKLAVILFNLGGPDQKASVEPFLFNLFNDKAIIGLPWPLRWLLAKLISKRRAPIAQEIYEHLGGGSPLLPNTVAQAQALEKRLDGTEGISCKVFITMRYWHPFAAETAQEVKAYDPDEIVLLPLYPQFSTTTSASSLRDWNRAAKAAGLKAAVRTVCCYPRATGFVAAVADKIMPLLAQARENGPARLLFSAHGLPKKVIDRGDPYQWQVEQTAEAVVNALALPDLGPDLDYVVCYQSRVGPLEWIGPATEEEIERAGQEGRSLVVCPIAFVSEHSETLVELDIEYGELAEKAGVPLYLRVPTVDAHPAFIEALADAVLGALTRDMGVGCQEGRRICPGQWAGCPLSA